MSCNRQIRRFKTETVEYLKTRRKLLAVEHGKLSKDNGTCKLSDSSGGEREFRTSVLSTGKITVAWRKLATTVAKEWNGNQMQIWLPFVFYTPSVHLKSIFKIS